MAPGHSRLEDVNEHPNVDAALILVAAGSGTRLGAGIPKALVTIEGRSLLQHCLDRATQVAELAQIVVVVPPSDELLAEQARPYGPRISCVPGGATRAESVGAGLEAVDQRLTRILVHDVARALTPSDTFERVLQTLEDPQRPAVIPALPVTDTISVIEQTSGSDTVRDTPARASLRAVQTPQGFHAPVLRAAHAALREASDARREAVTDDASLVRAQGYSVTVIAGDRRALKITHPQDIHAARIILRDVTEEDAMDQPLIPRIGNAIDVHAVSKDPQRPMWLAGLLFADDVGLDGHSDGDAVAHAACDALFSAAGIGDLGTHFGVDRPEMAGASGTRLLAEAARIVRAAGYQIGNVSVQFVGRRPRFAARREEANQVLSDAAQASVTVTATTSDGLGYEGEGAGITAYATALVYRRD